MTEHLWLQLCSVKLVVYHMFMQFSVHVMSVKSNLHESRNTNTEGELCSEMHTT
jgi:hypothetical protein